MIESDDEDTVPGPGAYNAAQRSDFKPETKPQRLQFFGSTVERFTESNKFKQNDEVGPGSYPQPTSAFTAKSIKPGARTRKPISFQSG